MEDISRLIARATEETQARSETQRAFGEIVRRFQDLAFGCAYAVLGDFHQAEDAAQEAFLSAWRNLDQLRKPEAFPGWFKRIVLTQCNRQTRGKRLETLSLTTLADVPEAHSDPREVVEQREFQAQVREAIESLPESERLVTTLFYIGDYSQNELAAFLELPVTTVKKRLFCARRRLRERMLHMVKEMLRENRPSRNDQFANTVALFNEALDSFVAKIKQDRYILAAILFGSLSHDTVWRKSDIDLILVGREEKPIKDFYLVENGVNIHAMLIARSKFRQMIEGGLQGSFLHSSFALSTLLYTTDDTIREYYQNVRSLGSRDRQMRLLTAGQSALYTLAKAEKWFYTRKDLSYSFVWLLYTVDKLATIEVLLNDEITTREVIPQAVKINPAFFNKVYFDLIHQKKEEAVIQQTLDLINEYLDGKTFLLFRPIFEFLCEAGGIRTTTDMDTYFKKQAQEHTFSLVYEWLADKGLIQKVPSPLRLTEKSRIEVDEAAYYYDGGRP